MALHAAKNADRTKLRDNSLMLEITSKHGAAGPLAFACVTAAGGEGVGSLHADLPNWTNGRIKESIRLPSSLTAAMKSIASTERLNRSTTHKLAGEADRLSPGARQALLGGAVIDAPITFIQFRDPASKVEGEWIDLGVLDTLQPDETMPSWRALNDVAKWLDKVAR